MISRKDLSSFFSQDIEPIVIKQIDNKDTDIWLLEKHYAKRKPSRSFSFGIFINGGLEGVVTYGVPSSPKLSERICGIEYKNQVFELNRLCLNSDVPKNSASMLVGKSLKLLPKDLILVSYADIGQGHTGYIYQATNWLYTGITDKSGCFSKIEVGDKVRTSKSFYDELGTQTKSVILEHYPDAVFHPYTQKHRYIQFTGSKSQKKKFKKALIYDIYPYPKGDNKQYDCPDIKNGRIVKK